MKNEIKILQIGASAIGRGGRSTITFQLCQNIENPRYKFDFLCMSDKPEKLYCDMVEEKGGKILSYQSYKSYHTEFHRILFLIKEIQNKNYDIIHINTDDALEFLPRALICKIAGAKYIIAHGHTSKANTRLRHVANGICQMFMPLCCNFVLGCSVQALEHLYAGKFIKKSIVENGVAFEKFEYDENVRNRIRKENSWENKFIIGHVGRFSFPKNHPYIIEIFKYIVEIKNDAILLLVGDGEDKEKIEELVHKYNIENKVIFWGTSDHIEQLLWAMDAFLFPSLYEGFSIALLEAEASILPTYISSNILAMNSPYLTKISLDTEPKKWASIIVKDYLYYQKTGINRSQQDPYNLKWINNTEYNIKKSSKKLEKIYSNIVKNS